MSKILVVDDSMVIRKMLTRTLTNDGHNIDQAENGSEGFDIFEAQDFDLIISDINMPIMGGLDLCRKIRGLSDEKGKIPIIILSTEFSDEVKQEGKEIGVNAWMVKPCDDKLLIKAVTQLLNKS